MLLGSDLGAVSINALDVPAYVEVNPPAKKP